jgi:hypothetical protein
MSAKAKGSRRERQARDLLLAAGYWVTKAGGSLGVFDLVAIPGNVDVEAPQVVRLVQVKSNVWCGRDERARMEGVAATLPGYCWVEQWRCDDRRGWRKRRWNGHEWEEA